MLAPARSQVAVLLGCATALALACSDENVNPLGTGGAGTTTSTASSTGTTTASSGGTTSQGGMGGMLGTGGLGMGGMLGTGGLGMGGMLAAGGMGGMPGAGGAGGGLIPVLVPDFAILDANPNSTTSGQLVSPRDHLGRVSAWYFGHST
jgi:hypothetical protein